MVVYEVYDCTAHVSSDILLLARLLLTAFPSPSVASWGMQCSAGAATSHPSQASTSPPVLLHHQKEPWPDVVQVDVPYGRTMGGLHTLIRGQNLAFHTSCSPQSPCAVLPLHPARPRRRGLNKVQRTDGAAREWLSWLWIVALSLV